MSTKQPRVSEVAVNPLIPPSDAIYWSRQEYTIFSNIQVPDPKNEAQYVTIDWKFAAHIYASGARPDQPDFHTSGGSIYIVLLHQGCINSTLVDGYQDVTLAISTKGGASVLSQIPQYTTESGDYWLAKIEYHQALQMFRELEDAPKPFDARYTLDYKLEKMEQTGRTYNGHLEIYFSPTPGSAWQTPKNFSGLSVFTSSNPQGFPITLKFDITATFGDHAGKAEQLVILPLGFSA